MTMPPPEYRLLLQAWCLRSNYAFYKTREYTGTVRNEI